MAEHLAARGTLNGLHESVVLVGSDTRISELVQKSRLPLTMVSQGERSDELHLQGAPYLLIVDPNDSVRYAGGYATDRNARTGYQDTAIWNKVSSGASYPALPIFGCAVEHGPGGP